MSSNPLWVTEVETLLLLAARGRWSGQCAESVCAGCGRGLIGLAAQFSDESPLEVCIHVMRYTNRRLYFYFFYFTDIIGADPHRYANDATRTCQHLCSVAVSRSHTDVSVHGLVVKFC